MANTQNNRTGAVKAQKKAFEPKEQFWLSILQGFFTLMLLAGIEIPVNPADLAGQVVSLVQSPTGYFSLIGLFVTALASPLWKFVRNGAKNFKLADYLGSPNTVIAIATIVVAALVYKGVNIPANAASDIVNAAFAKDYTLLVSLAFTHFLNPILRWFRDQRAAVPA